MDINTDTNEMKAICLRLKNSMAEFRDIFSGMQQNLDTCSSWTGKDSTVFRQRAAALCAQINGIAAEMENVEQSVAEYAKKYEDADKASLAKLSNW